VDKLLQHKRLRKRTYGYHHCVKERCLIVLLFGSSHNVLDPDSAKHEQHIIDKPAQATQPELRKDQGVQNPPQFGLRFRLSGLDDVDA